MSRHRPLPHPSRRFAAPLLIALLLSPLPARALPQGSDEGGEDAGGALATRVFAIRYKDVDDVYLLVSPHLGPRGSIRAQPRQKTLAVVDTEASLARIAALVAAYDLPPRTVEVSVQLIMATAGPGATEEAPPPIRGVIEKLNALSTRWNDYRLLGSARVLGTEGERTHLRVGDDYRVDFRIDEVSDETRVIRFRPFELQKRDPRVEGNERYEPVLNTVLNLRDSQVFIVGASKVERSNRALFMTITAALQRP